MYVVAVELKLLDRILFY